MNYKREVRDCFLVEMNTANVIAKPLKEQQELDPCRKFALNMWGHMFLYHHNARHSLRKVSTLYELLIMSNSLEFYLKSDNIVDFSRCNCILFWLHFQILFWLLYHTMGTFYRNFYKTHNGRERAVVFEGKEMKMTT